MENNRRLPDRPYQPGWFYWTITTIVWAIVIIGMVLGAQMVHGAEDRMHQVKVVPLKETYPPSKFYKICLEGHVYYWRQGYRSETLAPKLNDDGTPTKCPKTGGWGCLNFSEWKGCQKFGWTHKK